MTPPATYEYKVQLKLVNPNTGAERVVTCVERAYNPMDAWMQALLVISQSAGSADITLLRISPPERPDEGNIAAAVEAAVFKLLRGAERQRAK